MCDFFEDYIKSKISFNEYLSLIEKILIFFPNFKEYYYWSAISMFNPHMKTIETSPIKTSDSFNNFKEKVDNISNWLSLGIKSNQFSSYTELILNSYTSTTITIAGQNLIDLFSSKENFDKIVMGLPVGLKSGEETSNSERVRKFADKLKLKTGLPIEFADERFSSHEADSMGGQAYRDEKAAMVILQEYLAE